MHLLIGQVNCIEHNWTNYQYDYILNSMPYVKSIFAESYTQFWIVVFKLILLQMKAMIVIELRKSLGIKSVTDVVTCGA